MQALLFEVEPRAGHEDHYFDHAARLRPLLEAHDGLLFIDRYKSLSRPGIILSHSHWRDEASIARWRTDAQHQVSQAAGRNTHFKDYRIRVFHVLETYSDGGPIASFPDEGAYLDPARGPARFRTIVATQGAPFPNGGEAFASVNSDTSYLSVKPVANRADGSAVMLTASRSPDVTHAMCALVTRDYGMSRRDEAPQYFPATGA